MKYQILLYVFLLVNTFKGFAQQHEKFVFNPRTYVCNKVSKPPVIDGLMKEEDWQVQPWTTYFTDIEGNLKPKPLQDTRVKMLWDENYFYLFARLEETDIWATYRQRDTIIFQENDFEIFIDPDGDTHLYYEFEINALNTVWDLMLIKPYRDGGPQVTGWNINGLQSATHIEGTLNQSGDTDRYWDVEIAFPWRSLVEAVPGRKMPKDDDQWRINFSRVNWQLEKTQSGYKKKINPETGKSFPEYNWVWSEQGKIKMHQPETWGYVQFSDEKPSTNVAFHHKKEEVIKWRLRELYYKQKKFFAGNGKYEADISEAGCKVIIYPSGFLITYTGDEGTWNIREDGKVWKSK